MGNPTPKVALNLSLSVEAYEAVKARAIAAGMPVGTWVRKAIGELAAGPIGPMPPTCETCGVTIHVSKTTGHRYCNCGKFDPWPGWAPAEVGT